MTSQPLTEDQIIAQIRHKLRWQRLCNALFVLLWSAIFGLYLYAVTQGWLEPLGITQTEAFSSLRWAIWIWLFGLIAISVVLGLRFRRTRAEITDRICRRTIDIAQRERRFSLLGYALAIFLYADILHIFDPVSAPLALRDWIGLGVFLLATLTLAGTACFGPGFLHAPKRHGLDDELATALRTTSVKCGYISLIAALCAIIVTLHTHPDWALPATVLSLCAGVAVPLIVYVFLEWRAGRDD